MDFKDVLKELRNQYDMSQADLASKMKCSVSSISMYENGNREPDRETMELIADIFNVDMNYLYGRKTSLDDELSVYLEDLRYRPEMRMLFSAAKTATKEDIEKAVKIIETLKGE